MKVLHITFQAYTATFKMPFINTGVAISAPVPSYSNIVGLISCCKGSLIEKNETLIGFKYSYDGIGRDLETTTRLFMDSKKEILKRNPEKGIIMREFHVNPKLDIYLDNLELKKFFERPIGVPTLGRSQDIAWISNIEIIEVEEACEGKMKPTLIPFPCEQFGGRVIRYCDYFYNNELGYLRKPDKMILYQVVPQTEEGVFVRRNNLYKLPDSDNEVIYMHRLGDET
jgi:CRISPR-associated protein Cas5t